MAEDKKAEAKQADLTNTDLAYERTLLAVERTLMAWIRTAISMISFGFTIYKFFADFAARSEPHNRLLSSRVVGMTMIFFALLGLLLAQIEYYRSLKKLRERYPKLPRSSQAIMAMLIWLFGLILFLAAAFRE